VFQKSENMDIKGKTALVTGAATGIGLEYVKELLRNGAQVSHKLKYIRLSQATVACIFWPWISMNFLEIKSVYCS
jgi:hypothetical protein